MLLIKNLSVQADNKLILEKLNIKIKNEEIHCLMGPNGSGKSTICQTILGSLEYQVVEGSITLNNVVLENLDATSRAKLGIYLISQNPQSIEGVTNAEMLRMALSERTGKNVGIFEFNKKITSICEKIKLDKKFIHKQINVGASGGERKKIELLHMWMLEPNFIILDEIDSGLDIDNLKIVLKSIKEYLSSYHASMLFISHNPSVIKTLKPDYVHVLNKGKIVKTGDISLAKQIEKNGFSFDKNELSESVKNA